jgi:hypothetical protein
MPHDLSLLESSEITARFSGSKNQLVEVLPGLGGPRQFEWGSSWSGRYGRR